MTAAGNPIRLAGGPLLAGYAAALGFAVALSWTWVALAFDPPYRTALLAGWILAAGNAAAGLLIKWIGTRGDFGWFLLWAVGISGLRLLLLLGIVVAAHRWDMAPFQPFVISLFAGFFSCLACEILVFHLSTIRDYREA